MAEIQISLSESQWVSTKMMMTRGELLQISAQHTRQLGANTRQKIINNQMKQMNFAPFESKLHLRLVFKCKQIKSKFVPVLLLSSYNEIQTVCMY